MAILNVLPLNLLVITLFLATGAAVEGKWAISLAGCGATVLAAVALRRWMRYWGWDSRDARNVYVLAGILGSLGFVEGVTDEDYALSVAFLASVIAAIGLAEWLRRRDPARSVVSR